MDNPPESSRALIKRSVEIARETASLVKRWGKLRHSCIPGASLASCNRRRGRIGRGETPAEAGLIETLVLSSTLVTVTPEGRVSVYVNLRQLG